MPGARRQLFVDVHLVPADLVDPDHGPDAVEIVEPRPERGFFSVNGQCRNGGHLGGQLAENVDITLGQMDGFGDGRRRVVAGVVKHEITSERRKLNHGIHETAWSSMAATKLDRTSVTLSCSAH